MGTPRMSQEEENRRQKVVGQLPEGSLRDDASLGRVAETVRVICDVPMAHVSLMEDDHQCVVGEAGTGYDEYDRDQTFCAYTVAEGDVVIVEDATDDERFVDNPFVVNLPELRFYLGLPLIVEEVPIGTLCALDTEPREVGLRDRGELFGLVNTLETHLEAVYEHEAYTPEHGLASKVTSARALAARERYEAEAESTVSRMADLEGELQTGLEALADLRDDPPVQLGTASTAPDERDG